MTDPSPAAASSTPTEVAAGLVRLGITAAVAYERPDLAGRLELASRSLDDPAVHAVVIGEFKQGKSSLVNALLGVRVCPVDDDVATATPTFVRHGDAPSAELVVSRPGDDPAGDRVTARRPVALDELPAIVTEGADPPLQPGERLEGVDVRLPRKLLAGGLVLVDTPGVGGLGSAHTAASLGAVSLAEAVLFVTDASQELTRAEMDVLTQAVRLCPDVAVVLTKTDFYPSWRRVLQLNADHLRAAGLDVPILPVSSPLRQRAASTNDAGLNAESGAADLVRHLQRRVVGGAAVVTARKALHELVAVCDQLETQLAGERSALADPEAAGAALAQLTDAKERAEQLRSTAARWNQTLGDGIADLNADIDHDLRQRIRRMIQEADDAIERSDPADTWPEMEAWLTQRASYELVGNYMVLRDRALELSALVAEHFREASGEILAEISVYDPRPALGAADTTVKVDIERMGFGKQTMTALKASYSGVLMFSMLGSLVGIGLGPLTVGIGLVMGRKGLRDEKERQLQQRRAQAKNAVRRYCDEVSFHVGKDSRDTLRRVQRELRDYYSARAEEFNRSSTQALMNATEAARRSQAEREARLRDLDAELRRVRALRERTTAALAALGAGPTTGGGP